MTFRTALSGLNAASSDLSATANNIANNGTAGFKLSRAQFGDIYAASALGTSSNAIGSGVRLTSVAQQFSQGNTNFTSNNLDLAINGKGFFRLNNNGATVYSRAGAFATNSSGYIVNSDNQRLTGFLADSTGTITGAKGDLQIATEDIAPTATTTATVGINLAASASIPAGAFSPTDPTTYNNSTSTTVYDSLGASHLATLYYKKTAANTWSNYLYVDGTAAGGANALVFSSSGALTTPAAPGNIGPIAVPAGVTGGAAALSLTFNYSNSTQFGSTFGVNSLTQNGFTTGRLSGVDIDSSGVLFARYSNGQSRALGQLALTNFTNAQGLRPLGNTSWAESFSSGAALDGAPGSASLGVIQSGALEGSNVDITEQLVNMITAQRNFQANAQVITTFDSVTQSIINIR